MQSSQGPKKEKKRREGKHLVPNLKKCISATGKKESLGRNSQRKAFMNSIALWILQKCSRNQAD
jgi:hypothetical protein